MPTPSSINPREGAKFSDLPNFYASEMKAELLDSKFDRYDYIRSTKILAEDPNEVLGSHELEERASKL